MTIDEMRNVEWIVPWSGGKDSTATIIKMMEYGIPIKKIVHVRMMATNTLPAIDMKMFNFVNKCVESFRNDGLDVEVICSRPYDSLLGNKCYKRSKFENRIGKTKGFTECARGFCTFQKEKKRICDKISGNMMLGICADETARMRGNRNSLLFNLGITEKMAMEICRSHGMLSPHYESCNRDGCFFCPNARKNQRETLTSEQKAFIIDMCNKTPEDARRTDDWRFTEICDKSLDG